ncbi:MAG: T9SS type A sorting domain-containing protein [Balneolaceae bacterium]|nr:T9SS type A sorting domain-containing protein [Balneolaceae bacterium]MBO6545185.1 T9SS type A sorting domain-containing protein [Balneolaceae bacterium]MBO6646581.1 T9SS type A sorting domain-containing protein [Balneolaceae bacterium]
MLKVTIERVNKAVFITFALLLSFGAVNAQEKGLFFSEYIEGSGDNKAFEIFNPTDQAVDLGNYIVLGNFNGNPYNDTLRFPAGTMLASGDVYVVAHLDADAAITSEADTLVQNPFAGGSSFMTVFNGDDARGLFHVSGTDTTLLDVFGDPSEDPGSAWNVAGVSGGTRDHTLVRKPNFESGNTVPLASFGANEVFSEWIVSDQDDFSNIGSHEAGGVAFSIRELNRYREVTEFSVAGVESHPLAGETVEFTAVIVSYPKSSGLSNPQDNNNDGVTDAISRIHVFVTDTSAVTRGRAGMSLQIVETDYTTIDQFTRGDVVTFTGSLGYFNATAQFDVESVNLLGSVNEEFPEYAELLNPWEISVSDINDFTDGALSMKFESYSLYIGSYVKFNGAIVSNVSFGDRNSGGRSDWALNQDGSRIYIYDTSLRLRNDHAIGNEGYLVDYNARRLDSLDGEFVPPSAGANVDVSGFITYNGDDPDGLVPSGNGALSINPFEEGVVWLNNSRFVDGQDLGGGQIFSWPNDIVVNGLPAVFSNVALSDSNVTSETAVTVTATIVAVDGKTLTGVELIYTAGEVTDSLTMTASGDVYSATLPTFDGGTPVNFTIEATDSDGLVGVAPLSGTYSFFVKGDAVASIAAIQETSDGLPGDSPVAGVGAIDASITATVTTSALNDGYITIQDRAAAWSGVFVDESNGMEALEEGDMVLITELSVSEAFGVTEVEVLAFEELTANTQMDTLAITGLTTQEVRSNYEPYEGVMVKFDDVKVLTNQADGSSDFGEWEFGSRQGGGAADTLEVGDGLRFDDRSSRFSSSVNENIKLDATFESLTGVIYFSFSNPKMIGGNPDWFVSEDFTIPFRNFALDQPADEATVVVTGDVSPTWEPTTDFDGNDVTYEWVLYTADTSEVIVAVPSNNEGADTTVTLAFATVDGLLAGAGLEVGGTADFVWNVRVTDGSADTVAVSTFADGEFTPIYYSLTLERGVQTSNEDLDGVPDKFELQQNYPNPFNPTTNIQFSLPEASRVTLNVYDMLGRKVATLLDRKQLNAANHAVKFDASALASGMYIYRIEAGSFVSTRKMMLIK